MAEPIVELKDVSMRFKIERRHYGFKNIVLHLPQYIRDPYKRFVENRMRELWDFHGVPISIFFRAK